MSDPGLPLTGGTIPNLPGTASASDQTTSLNDIVNRLNGLLKSQNFSTGTVNIIQFGILPDGTIGLVFNDDKSNVVAKLGKQTDGSYNLKFFDSNNIGVAQFGRFADGPTSLKIAKNGIEVSTATNDQLIFNSSQDIFKIVHVGTGSTPVTSITDPGAGLWSSNSASSTAYAHKLGYIPAVVAFVIAGGGYIPLPYTTFNSGVGSTQASWTQYAVQVDDTNVYLISSVMGIHISATVASQAVKFYLLQESAA